MQEHLFSTETTGEHMMRETLFAALLLVSGVSSYVSLAQEKAELPYPAESDITFQWTYSCPTSQCAFSCPGTGRAKQVTKLTIVMGRMRIGNNDDYNPIALFYEYSTKDIPRGNGFSIKQWARQIGVPSQRNETGLFWPTEIG